MPPIPSDSNADRGTSLLQSEAFLVPLRKDLLRFAVLQLRNRELAEDVVQEALAAALAASDRFEQRATLKTWVFSILKNKIIDALRDRWTKGRIDIADAVGDDADFDGLFNAKGYWQASEMPSHWGNPEQTLENQRFWQTFEFCMTKMPETTARVFSMREFLGLTVEEICKELTITSSNCWVILHRARMSLRLCLQQHWFNEDKTAC